MTAANNLQKRHDLLGKVFFVNWFGNNILLLPDFAITTLQMNNFYGKPTPIYNHFLLPRWEIGNITILGGSEAKSSEELFIKHGGFPAKKVHLQSGNSKIWL